MSSTPAARALWIVESRMNEALTLESVACDAGVSPFHLTRAFGSVASMPLMRYLRHRRLSEAARRLAGGAPDILALAFESGYASHEAFTRAFRECFGLTPESLRDRGSTAGIPLMEPLRMDETGFDDIAAPRLVDAGRLLIAGLGQHHSDATSAGIPVQWQRFGPRIPAIAARVGADTFGVCCNPDDEGNIDYVCGVEVTHFGDLPADLVRLTLPARRYAVFHHPGHVSEIRRVWRTVWNQGLPAARVEAVNAPSFERYGASFDPLSGHGGFEIWIPVHSG